MSRQTGSGVERLTFGDGSFRLEGTVAAFALSPSKRLLAFGSDDIPGDLRVVDLETGAIVFRSDDTTNSIAFVDETTFFSAYAALRKHRVGESERLSFDDELGSPIAVAQKRGLIAAATKPDSLALEIATIDGRRLHRIDVASKVRALRFSNDETKLIVSLEGASLRIDVERGTFDTGGGASEKTSPLILADGRAIVVRRNRVLFVDRATGEPTPPQAPGHDDGISAIAMSHDGTLLATAGGFDRTILVWDVETGDHVATLLGHENGILSVAFSPDDRVVASGGRDGSLRLHDPRTGRLVTSVGAAHDHRSVLAVYSPRGELVTSGGAGDVALRDADRGQLRGQVAHLKKGSAFGEVELAVDATGEFVAAICPERELVVFPLREGASAVLRVPGDARDPSFAPDAPSLAFRIDNDLAVVAVPSGRVLRRQHAGVVALVCFLADGQVAYVLFGEREIEVLDVATGEVRMLPQPARPTALARGRPGEVAVGFADGAAALVRVPASVARARRETLAPLLALARSIARPRQLGGYREQPIVAETEGGAVIAERGGATFELRFELEGEGFRAAIVRLEPSPLPPEPQPSLLERVGSFFGTAEPPSPYAAVRAAVGGRSVEVDGSTFLVRGELSEPPTADELSRWLAALASV